jgi:hypothetical protein
MAGLNGGEHRTLFTSIGRTQRSTVTFDNLVEGMLFQLTVVLEPDQDLTLRVIPSPSPKHGLLGLQTLISLAALGFRAVVNGAIHGCVIVRPQPASQSTLP